MEIGKVMLIICLIPDRWGVNSFFKCVFFSTGAFSSLHLVILNDFNALCLVWISFPICLEALAISTSIPISFLRARGLCTDHTL